MAKLTEDGFTNFVAKLGIGPQNLQSYATHSLAPFISRDRLSLEAAYRSSWLVGQVVDTVAEDMTREGINISTKISPDDTKKLQASMTHLKILPALADTIRWARLYGGAIAVILTEGADYSKPLNPEAISKGRFKGLLVLDRWMMDPSFGELVTEVGIHMGTPKYYRVLAGMPALAGQQIHYTRIVRFDGIILPFHQKMAENLWGLSVVERMFDRLIAFDSATAGASQLLHKAHLRTISVDGFRDALALGGKTEGAIIKQFNYIRLLQTMEGLTVLDGKDNFQTHTYTFSGISDLLIQFGQQISGATGIPLVRLFGQSPAGLSSTGESDLRNYYDHINKLQENQMRTPMQKILDILCRSELGRPLPDDLEFDFAPLWQLSDLEKSQVVSSDVSSISAAYSAGIITKKIAMKELTENSRTTGRFTNISDEDIENAKEDVPMMGGEENPFGQPPQSEDTGKTLEELKQALESLGDVDDDNSLEELKAKLESLNMKEPVDKMPVKDKAFSKDGFFSKILKPLVALGIVLKLFSDNKTKLTAKERVDRIMGRDSDEQWVGVDLDGTLAKYYKWEGIENIGDPIPNMVQHVKKLIDQGEIIKIFTARIAEDPEAAKYIQAWLVENGLPILEVVNEKDSMMKLLIDDRAVQVETNTGKVLSKKETLDAIKKEFEALRRTVDEQIHAPKGGVSIKGKEYEGGEFIPGSVNQEEAKKAIEKKKKENEGSIKAKETTGVTKGFLETKRDKDGRLTTIKGKPLPVHISKFPIPPAWTDVIYNPNPKGSLLVFARDSKGRPQTRYSDEHWNTTDKAKFARVYELGKKIKQIDNQLKADIAKGKDEAIIAKLIKETAIRPGSDNDTKAEVKAYGAVTLEARHIKNKNGKVILDFIGKKGVQAVIPVNDKDIAKLILKKVKNKKPNQKVFDTNYGRVLKYADTLDGGGFLLKDFRTLEANLLANKMIKSIAMPTNKKECNAAMKQVAVAVAEKLNNTPSVVLKKYINPVIFAEWKLKAGVA